MCSKYMYMLALKCPNIAIFIGWSACCLGSHMTYIPYAGVKERPFVEVIWWNPLHVRRHRHQGQMCGCMLSSVRPASSWKPYFHTFWMKISFVWVKEWRVGEGLFDGKTENREKESKILCGPFIHSHSGCPLHMDPNSDSDPDPDADIAITTTFVPKTCVYVHTWIHTCVDMSKGLSCARKKQPKENRRRPWPFFVGKNIRFCVYVLPELSNITVCVWACVCVRDVTVNVLLSICLGVIVILCGLSPQAMLRQC